MADSNLSVRMNYRNICDLQRLLYNFIQECPDSAIKTFGVTFGFKMYCNIKLNITLTVLNKVKGKFTLCLSCPLALMLLKKLNALYEIRYYVPENCVGTVCT
ncbi:hypothetical protein GOODEAATRI_018852 [Goodea atripinnis]|uniref:Uncharacterized protein n=1 Tax=Goodea atripinnis TaxID=208336 RepID=A0ABV0NBP9_9TELE